MATKKWRKLWRPLHFLNSCAPLSFFGLGLVRLPCRVGHLFFRARVDSPNGANLIFFVETRLFVWSCTPLKSFAQIGGPRNVKPFILVHVSPMDPRIVGAKASVLVSVLRNLRFSGDIICAQNLSCLDFFNLYLSSCKGRCPVRQVPVLSCLYL